MTKDLVKFDTNQYLNPSKTLKFLSDSRKFVRENFKTNPKAAIQALNQVSAIQEMSAKIKLPEIQKEALVAKLTIQRDIGGLLIPIIKKGCKSPDKEAVKLQQLGINYDESKVWQRYASLPEYAWNYSISAYTFPSKAGLLNEVKRFREISNFLSKLKDVRIDPIAIKEYFSHGYTLIDVQSDLEKNGVEINPRDKEEMRSYSNRARAQEETDEQEESEELDEDDVGEVVDLLVTNSEGYEHVVNQCLEFFEKVNMIDNKDRENIQISMGKIHDLNIKLFKVYNKMQRRLGWK
jgi:hypothetical protein